MGERKGERERERERERIEKRFAITVQEIKDMEP
jgi:hypothetical protein